MVALQHLRLVIANWRRAGYKDKLKGKICYVREEVDREEGELEGEGGGTLGDIAKTMIMSISQERQQRKRSEPLKPSKVHAHPHDFLLMFSLSVQSLSSCGFGFEDSDKQWVGQDRQQKERRKLPVASYEKLVDCQVLGRIVQSGLLSSRQEGVCSELMIVIVR